MKVCTKCGAEKEEGDFYTHRCRNGSRRDCMCYHCKSCMIKAKKIWETKNKKKYRAWRAMNRKKKRRENPSLFRRLDREAKARYIARIKIDNPEKLKEIYKKTNDSHNSTIQGKLNQRMGWTLCEVLRSKSHNKNGRKWEELVGYTVHQLKKHLESLFTAGMNWEKFSKGKIHIDHIVPKCKFNFNDANDAEFKACWGLSNLQPLWAKDNLSKNKRTMAEFLAMKEGL